MSKYIVIEEDESSMDVATKYSDSEGNFHIRFITYESSTSGKWYQVSQFSVSAESLMKATELLDDE